MIYTSANRLQGQLILGHIMNINMYTKIDKHTLTVNFCKDIMIYANKLQEQLSLGHIINMNIYKIIDQHTLTVNFWKVALIGLKNYPTDQAPFEF